MGTQKLSCLRVRECLLAIDNLRANVADFKKKEKKKRTALQFQPSEHGAHLMENVVKQVFLFAPRVCSCGVRWWCCTFGNCKKTY